MHQEREVALFLRVLKNIRVLKGPVRLGAYDTFYNKRMILYVSCNTDIIYADMEEFCTIYINFCMNSGKF